MNEIEDQMKSWRKSHRQRHLPTTRHSANFSRHHYVWLAKTLKNIYQSKNVLASSPFAHILADKLADDNPNFDRELFLNNVFGKTKDKN